MALYAKLQAAIAQQDGARSTLSTYWFWARQLYAFVKKPASQWTGQDVQHWLVHLHRQNYSGKSRHQALCAAAFIFRHVIKADMGKLQLPPMPRQRKTLKTIPTREEIGRVFAGLKGQPRLVAALLYGSGLRVEECCRLRVQDIDFARLTVRIHSGKGDKSRLTILPTMLVPALQRHLAWRKSIHEIDAANGGGLAELPGRLARKYPRANRELRWQFLFPSCITHGQYRWHITPEAVQLAMRQSVAAAGIIKRITPHTLRHAFATHSMRMGNDIETVRQLLGHDCLETTAIYLHADAAKGFSPLDVAMSQPLPVAQLE